MLHEMLHGTSIRKLLRRDAQGHHSGVELIAITGLGGGWSLIG